jgi:hypothetical protein
MRRWRLGLALLSSVFLFGACGSAPAVTPVPQVPTVPAFGWDTKPGSIVVRFDRILNGEPAVNAANRLPLCTVYGDGHLVWLNFVPPASEEVLEARLNDATLRSFIDYAIRDQHFYSLPDYASKQLPPEGKYTVESITLNLNNEVRTIRNYGPWSNNEFQTLLDKCTHLTSQPVSFLPTGAWLTAQTISESNDPRLEWSPTIGFKLSGLTDSSKPMWISGEVLNYLWQTQRRTLGAVQWLEDGKSYKLGLQVPGISRDAPPAPQVTPTMPTVLLTATPTTAPTQTSPPVPNMATAPPSP